jgi:hypothetical protein
MIRSVLVAFLFLFALAGNASAQNCATYPNNLTNGTNADATQVMGNFAYVLGCVRDKLTAARTYYVRTDGNDACNGLTNAAGSSGACAFLTIQKAITTAATLDLSAFNVTINVASGTYTGGISVTAPWVGSGVVTVVGDTTTPSNVVISTTSADAIFVNGYGSTVTVKGLKLQTTTSGHGLHAGNGGVLYVTDKMVFGTSANYHLYAEYGGTININNISYSISGNAGTGWAHMATVKGLVNPYGTTVSLLANVSTSVFAFAGRGGLIEAFTMTFALVARFNQFART